MLRVSPEFILRPSLSEGQCTRFHDGQPGVSPEFILRPSLSAAAARKRLHALPVSPEFILRPSLSADLRRGAAAAPPAGVAGVYTPAFVERRAWMELHRAGAVRVSPEFILRPSLSGDGRGARRRRRRAGVAGVYTPAFVERTQRSRNRWTTSPVSPEFILRPSLSGEEDEWYEHQLDAKCRRSLYSGLR